MFAVIRIRGTAKIERSIADTLKILKLAKPHTCVVLKKTPVYEGMLKKVKDYVTWGEIKPEMLEQLIAKRGKSVSVESIRKGAKEAAKKIEGETGNAYGLAPPRKGFSRKGIIKGFRQGGELGYRGEKINELIERML